MEQRLELKLELRLKQRLSIASKQELKQEMEQRVVYALKQIVTPEFSTYINIEDDDDVGLLYQSLPFLVLHEVSHVLQQKGKLNVYQPKTLPKLEIFNISLAKHHLNEIGIDKGAFTCGIDTDSYSEEEMISSHCALLERVFRDTMHEAKFNPLPEFYVRSDAALSSYLKKTLNQDILNNIEKLRGEVRNYFTRNGMLQESRKLSKVYKNVFDSTRI